MQYDRMLDTDENYIRNLLIGYGVAILLLIIIYFVAFRPYKRFLLNRYGYGLTTGPTRLGVFGSGAVFALQLFGVNDLSFIPIDLPIFEPPSTPWDYVLMLLGCAAPGVLLATLWCLIKTKNLLVAAINIPILFIYCTLCGFLIIFYVGALILGAMGVGMFAGLAAGPKAKGPRETRIIYEEDNASDFYDN